MRTKVAWILTPLLVLLMSFSYGQEKTITGNVKDFDGLPLPGVSVLVVGTTTGTQTDFDGNYTIKASVGQVLRYSYIGQKTTDRKVGSDSTMNLQMEEDAESLNEVIVTALGIERKPRELSYAAQTVKGDEVTKTKAVNVATAMVGKVSGMQINTINNSVNPSTRVVLRGNRSLLGNNEALIVVDGFPSSRGVLDRINPNDIEDVTVLKGANAAALYGSDAGNGVLVITTKKGKGKLKVTYDTSYQLENVAYLPELQDQFGAGGFPDGTLYPLENVNWGPRYDGRLVDASETYEDGRVWQVPFTPIKNNHKNFFNTGSTMRHGVTLSGGDDKGGILMSLDQTNTEGTVPKDRYNRTNFRLKANRTFDKLELGGNISFYRSFSDQVGNGGRQDRPVYWNVLNTPLHIPLAEMKNWQTGEFTRNEVSYYRFYENPYFIIDTQRENSEYTEFNVLANASYHFNDWITATVISGYTGGFSNFKRKFGAFSYAFTLPDAYANMDPYGARTLDQTSNSTRFNNDLMLNFDKELNDDFSLNLTVGHNVRIQSSKSINVSGSNLIIPDFYNVSTRKGELQGGESTTEYRRFGVYGDLTLGYKDFLFLNATARNDWSSTLPKGSNSFFYPSAGVSFVASDAFPEIKGDSGLSYLKLSTSISKTGNDPGSYDIINVFEAPTNFPYGSIAGLSQSGQISDPDLNPEFTKSIEGSVEFGLFRSRLNGSVTMYKSNSTDQLVPISISVASGASQSLRNIGEIENRGLEIDLNGTIVKSENFNWKFGVNYANQETEVISLADGVDELTIGGFNDNSVNVVARVGENYPLLRTTAYSRDDLGRVIVDGNGDPLQSSDPAVQGQTTPDYTIGFNTTITLFKNLTLYAVADYRTGHVFFNDLVNALEFTGLTQHGASAGRQPFVFPNSSYSDGSGGYVANDNRLTSGGGNAFWDKYGGVKENYVTDATTLKLRELALSYSFDNQVLEKLGISSLNLGVFGRNLFTWRPKDNVYTDPEFNFTGGNAVGIGTQSQTPPTRLYGVNLSVTF